MSEKIYQYYYIYKTTNLINGKYYYGMHSTDNLSDGYLGSGTKLKRSINKHGKENFKTEILEFLPNKIELIKREKEIINENVLNDPNSMNLQPGGGGGLSGEEHKKKFVSAGGKATKHLLKKYREDHLFNMKNNPEYREKFLDKMRGNTNWLGKTHKEETKRKMSLSKQGMYDGEKNSQYGTCWITNGIVSDKIKKGDLIPEGWKLGRKIKKD
jgi:group I intron endonuclease